MKLRDTISEAVRAAAGKGEPALVAFLTAGYPAKSRFREHLQAIAAGADVVEIGVPSPILWLTASPYNAPVRRLSPKG